MIINGQCECQDFVLEYTKNSLVNWPPNPGFSDCDQEILSDRKLALSASDKVKFWKWKAVKKISKLFARTEKNMKHEGKRVIPHGIITFVGYLMPNTFLYK